MGEYDETANRIVYSAAAAAAMHAVNRKERIELCINKLIRCMAKMLAVRVHMRRCNNRKHLINSDYLGTLTSGTMMPKQKSWDFETDISM